MMTNAPYPIVRFGDVARQVTDSTQNPLEDGFERYIGLEHLDPESLKIRRWGLIEETETTFTRVFRAGQVLFGRRRAYQRKAALAEFDGICSGDIIVMEAIPERLLPELLPFIVQTEGFYEYALSTSAGSLSPRTKWSALAKYEFPLPPLDEQRRIAEILWAAEVNHREAQNVADIAKTLLVRACQEWTYYPNALASGEWKKLKLRDCAVVLDSQRVPLNQSERSGMKGDIPYYGANGVIDYINDFVFDEDVVLLGEDGDHFMKYNDWEQAFLVKGKCWVNNHAHVFKANPEHTTNDWLYRFFQHRNILPYLQDSASMTRKKLTQGTLHIISVPMPEDICEQQKVTEAIEHIEQSYKTALNHVEHCKNMLRNLIDNLTGKPDVQ